MAINTSPNSEYTTMIGELERVRDAVLGSFFVKRKPIYLPHPSQVDVTSEDAVERYRKYVAGAEFPEFTKSTLIAMLDKTKINDTSIELNPSIDYLIEDSDGNGLSMKGLLESCESNILQAGWHVLLADYKGLTEVGINQPSIADVERLKPRATINQYSRENVIDWAFGRVNGKMQLIYMLLREIGETVDTATGQHTKVESFLKLAIDQKGYYQQKVTKDDLIGTKEGDLNPVIVGGKQLQFIPVEIVSDRELQPGCLPLDTGFLTAIADLAYYRYMVSAEYKDCLASLKPTRLFTIPSQHDWDNFKEMNGRGFLLSGGDSCNIITGEAKLTISESIQDLGAFIAYFAENKEAVKAIGGVYNAIAVTQRTATEVINEAEMLVSVLGPMVDSIETAAKKMCLYCGMFEGAYQADNLEGNMDDIMLSMPRKFAVSKLSTEEVKAYMLLKDGGSISSQELLRVLDLGGWLVSEADAIMEEIETTVVSLTQ